MSSRSLKSGITHWNGLSIDTGTRFVSPLRETLGRRSAAKPQIQKGKAKRAGNFCQLCCNHNNANIRPGRDADTAHHTLKPSLHVPRRHLPLSSSRPAQSPRLQQILNLRRRDVSLQECLAIVLVAASLGVESVERDHCSCCKRCASGVRALGLTDPDA